MPLSEKKQPKPTTEKSGRNPDGTFNSKQPPQRKGGNKPKAYSFRELAKLHGAELDPRTKRAKLREVVDVLYQKAMEGDVQAIDKVIKLTGNYDPDKSQVEMNDRRNPFADLTDEQLKRLHEQKRAKSTSTSSKKT